MNKHALKTMADEIKMEIKSHSAVTPSNYSLANALSAAYLILEETFDRNKKPALDVCTPESIHRALLYMGIQGLSPAKSQCYFIVYGQQLQCIRSYMGSQMIAKIVNPAIFDIRAQLIYEEETFEFDIIKGKNVFKPHQRNFNNINRNNIAGAYAVAVSSNEDVLFNDIMTIDDIKQSWKQSKMKGVVAESGAINQQTTHGKFTGEMAKRTIINRLCKHIINTSDDTGLITAAKKTDEERSEVSIIQEEIDQKANRKLINITPSNDVEKPETGPPMANEDQCREIFILAKKANRHEQIIENVSSFIGREIGGLKDLTEDEANDYIEMMTAELKESTTPDWAPK